MSYWAHETAVIDQPAEIGEGTKIWHFCHVMAGARIGQGCSLGQNVFVASTVRIGDGCKIQNNVSLYDGVELEDEVFVGPSAVFTNVVNPRAGVVRKSEYRPTKVGRGATIGANATVVCGHPIGEYAFVGAGAVVSRPVPSYSLVLGVPGRVVGWVCRCGERLSEPLAVSGVPPVSPATPRSYQCGTCQSRYELHADRTLVPTSGWVPGRPPP